MDILISNQEARVLGCLMEKAMATPEYYPLSLNALANACNQKSNRDPVVSWNEQTVEDAVDGLEKNGLVNRSTVGRVPKYEEIFTRQHNMVASEAAVLCVLLLRGPQTPGAIRSRTDRLHAFDGLDALQETLDRLCEWGRVHRLERLPGHKECRYMHLLSGEPDVDADSVETADPTVSTVDSDRLMRLDADVQSLKDELADLRSAFELFRKQFE
ncbi:YceH family protein [Desulfosarcina sp.]|uniref:YceH family protein n=1 Tax=Desulfosarcina sp. TaxID=2027861 RepID=UPI0029BA60A5|nr:YceH family protein [Desulfosarcina sp.]MDX2454249.1 YceH family protein [Desulfosarcina sp.]MDX2491916.1 YceH family protein [Desulfosarcina sp.]